MEYANFEETHGLGRFGRRTRGKPWGIPCSAVFDRRDMWAEEGNR